MSSQTPDGQAPAQPNTPVDVMEALGLRVQLSFPEFLALPPDEEKGSSQ